MTSSVPAAAAWPVIGLMVLVVALRLRWFRSTPAERYLNATLVLIILPQLLREQAIQNFVAARSPLTATMLQQLSLCAILVSIVPFLCVISLLSGANPAIVRRKQILYCAAAGMLSLVMLLAGATARAEQVPLEVCGGWDGVLVGVAFSILPLVLAVRMATRCSAEFQQQDATLGERVMLGGIAASSAVIAATTSLAVGLAFLQELGLVESVAFRLRVNAGKDLWIAAAISAVAAAPPVKAAIGAFGYDATGRRWRRLRSLWESMAIAFPESMFPLEAASGTRRITTLRLHRGVVEIRDVLLRLRPYRGAVDSQILARFTAREGIPDRERGSAEAALQLAFALRDRIRVPETADQAPTAASASETLDDEVADLLRLARWWLAACRFVTAE